MDIEFFQKHDFGSSGDAVVKFTGCGAVIINHRAMEQLGLGCGDRVLIGYDKKNTADFVICKSSNEGWVLRSGNHGEGVFNSVGLMRRVVGATWERKSHAPGENKITCVSFKLAKLPIDDGENCNVFALLRKER
jgi:hypothetical protein